MMTGAADESTAANRAAAEGAERYLRFFDNRQRYLLFVHTCDEKWAVAKRVSQELAHLTPRAPALRIFDAGVGDGSVLTRVMRSLHDRFPNVPFYVVGKEISLEDVRLALEKMPDRFYEHPATVLVMTNMFYSEAPWLRPNSTRPVQWVEVALEGATSSQFERQIMQLRDLLADGWRTHLSPKTGNPLYERPVVLVLYRADHALLLDSVRPQQAAPRADFDLVIASQPYRARAAKRFKAEKVLAPLTRALGPGGRLIGIHSRGDDPGLEIVRRIWPGENPFVDDRQRVVDATREVLGEKARGLRFEALPDAESLFRYELHTLPNEISSSIGSSTLMAAWNAAVYVAQIEEPRLEEAMKDGRHLEVTRDVLREYGKLWFQNESYVIVREPFGAKT
jgi:SAM-dependent methyltransferase